MSKISLKFKIDGYAPVSINSKAFDVPPSSVEISREEDVWTAVIQFATAPTTLCEKIIECTHSYKVSELHLPESVNAINAPLGWLEIAKPENLTINKTLLSADGNLIIQNNTVVRQIGEAEVVSIPEGITTIGESAFAEKKDLTKVEFPSSVTHIERKAFSGCWQLPVKLPRNLESIGDYAFEDCGRDKPAKLTIPGKVEKIGNFAFKGCCRLSGVKIGKAVKEIGQGAFASCERIKTFEGIGSEHGSEFLVFGKRLISVALDTSMMDLSELVLPDDIEEIGDWAFTYDEEKTHWRKITKLPSGLKRIGARALYGSGTSGSPVVIPESVEEIGEGAFSPEMRVTGKYVTEDGVVIKDGVLLFKNFTRRVATDFSTTIEKTPEYTVPAGVTRIGDNANLEIGKLRLPEGLESIGKKAIVVAEEISIPSTLHTCESLRCESGCASLEFPEGVTSLGTTYGLQVDVKEIVLHSDPPRFNTRCYGKALLVVPKEKFAAYKEAYTGLLDEHNSPNGRIAYRNDAGELCYEMELSDEGKAKKEEQAKEFWQDFEALAMSNEKFFDLLSRCPHGVMEGDGERYYFIDILPEYLRIELRYAESRRNGTCTLCQLQNEFPIYNNIHPFYFKNATGLDSELIFTRNGNLKNCGIRWTMPEDLDNVGIYGLLYAAAVVQAEMLQPKIQKYLDQKAYEQRVASGNSMYRKFYKQDELTEVEIPATSGVTDFREMFEECEMLQTIPLFDTSSGIGFDSTFQSCSALTSLPEFDFSNAESIDSICLWCQNLESVEWATTNVKNFNSAFTGCEALRHIVLDLSSATETDGIFNGCKKLSDATLINLGANPDCRKLALESLTKWAKKNVIDSLVKLSFDRTAAGYEPVEISVSSKALTVLKPEDIAKIEAKGYKLTR